MTLKVIASISALVLALTFSGQASAQTMIGGVEVSAADLPKVQEQCDKLAAAPATSLSTDSTGTSAATETEEGTATETGTVSGSATAINLASITVEDCVAAGLSSSATTNPNATTTTK